MKIRSIASEKWDLSICSLMEEERLAGSSDFLDLMAACPSSTIVLRKEDFDEKFFDLRSGIAGEILQKVSNYRRRLVILGEYRGLGGKALKDFIYESNRTGQVVFAPDLETAVDLLR